MTGHDHAWFRPHAETAAGGSARNPFDSEPVARRYAGGRSYYHRTALALAAGQLELQAVDLALDLGCGAGMSTRAAREHASRVVALDVSVPMLRGRPACRCRLPGDG